jgi:protein-S-isoprenylcysteine O-methyltransferase Ste14
VRQPAQPARLATPLFFGLVGVFTGVHASESVARAIGRPTLHLCLVAAYALLRTAIVLAFAAFTIGRVTPARRARNPVALAACLVAIATVVAFASPGTSVPAAEVVTGEFIAVLSGAWLLMAVSHLGRCFGVLPEARGLVTSGPYRRVRHPVYLGELGASLGLAIASPSLGSALLLAVFAAAQAVRMVYEERALAEAFPAYHAYAACTPRLLPWPSPGALRRALPARKPALSVAPTPETSTIGPADLAEGTGSV